MKKYLLLTILLLSGMAMMADDVEKLDASKITRISFDGDIVILTYRDGTTSTVTDVETIVIDFSIATSIGERLRITQEMGLEGKQVYDLKGHRLGNSAATLKKGVYVIDGKKVIVK